MPKPAPKKKQAIDPKINVQRVTEWRRRMKDILVESMGRECQICGYARLPSALDFHHHFGPKSFSISSMISNIRRADIIIAEAIKCVLLCANCHREVHAGLAEIPVNAQKLDVDLAQRIHAEKIVARKGRVSEEHIMKTLRRVREKAIKISKQNRPGYENTTQGCPIYARREKIRQSEIDFSRFGWVKELGVLLDMTPQAAGRWMRKHMPEFYSSRCFVRKNKDA